MEKLKKYWKFVIIAENRLQDITDNVRNEDKRERKKRLSELYIDLCIQYNQLFKEFSGKELQEQELSEIARLAPPQHSAIRSSKNSIGELTRVNAISNMLEAYQALIVRYASIPQNKDIQQLHTSEKPSKWRYIIASIIAAIFLISTITYFILREVELKKDYDQKIVDLKKKHDQKIVDFKLWTAYKVQDSAQYKEQFDTLIEPLKVFADNFYLNRLNDTPKNSNIDITNINELDTLSIKEDHPKVRKYQDSILYDFSGGFVSYSPHSLRTDSILELADMMFRPSEKFLLDEVEKQFKDTEIPSLELGLEKILDTKTEETIFSPILFYGLYTRTINDKKKRDAALQFDSTALMYRFPRYVHIDTSKRLSLLENYHHLPRKYYDEFMNGKAHKLSDNIFLSSVYFDYKRKTPTPIRTLMMKLSSIDGENNFYLFCIDFKFKD